MKFRIRNIVWVLAAFMLLGGGISACGDDVVIPPMPTLCPGGSCPIQVISSGLYHNRMNLLRFLWFSSPS